MQLYDYIYVDLEKAISLYSQLTGGVVEVRESQIDSGRTAENKRKYDFKVFKHDAGGTSTDKESMKEVIKPYHSFLNELEQTLTDQNFVITLNQGTAQDSLRDEGFREMLKRSFAVKASGRCVIEDYERIKRISAAFPDVVKIINRSAQSSLKKSEEYQSMLRVIEEAEQETKRTKDRNQRGKANSLIKKSRKKLEQILENQENVEIPDQWILEGLRTWINTFLSGIVNLRMYPRGDLPDEQIFGHLKKECFCDEDLESLHFTYGSIPTAALTMLGVVASVPPRDEDGFDPLEEFARKGLSDAESVEKAFRGVFRGFDGFEQMIRTSRFPRVVVYPVLVYRTAEPNQLMRGNRHGWGQV